VPIGKTSADVVILGAGVSGLAAAARLTASGCTVHVLEARERIGGRILSVRGGKWPVPIDLGAEFIQGNIPELLEIAHASQLPVIELTGAPWIERGGMLKRADDFYDRIGRVLSRAIGGVSEPDQTVAEALGTEEESARLARGWIEAYDAAHIDRLSARALKRERDAEQQIAGDRTFRIITGYDGVPSALSRQISPNLGRVHLATIATEVHWSARNVSVLARSADAQTERTYTAARLVVALPVGVLQAPPSEAGAVRFVPPLADKERDLQALEMGNVVKLAFAFKDRFWQGHFSDSELGFLMTPDQPIRGWWTGYPLFAPLLIAWAGGPAADELSRFTMAERVDRALDSLSKTLGMTRGAVDEQLLGWDGHDWAADPFARGAYSYVRVGGIPRQADLARPVANTLFFAGEATEQAGHQATVHGALFAGRRAADEVLRSLSG
jgi:monoamine oxidase